MVPMILFLDFDGVTHEYACKKENHFSALPLIEEVVRQFSAENLQVVISSNWRTNTPWDEILSVFAPDVVARIVGRTPIFEQLDKTQLPAILGSYRREAECMAWMRANQPAHVQWVAVDDQDAWFRPFCPNLFLIEDCTTAFEAHHAPLLQEKIQRALAW